MHGETFSKETLAVLTKRQKEIDALPLPIRELVWDYGWGIVHAYIRAGITAATVIRHLIETTMNGSYETRERRRNTQRISPAGERMNKTLSEFSLPANGQALVESLRRNGAVLYPMKPTEPMIRASMDLLQTEKYANRVVPKHEKHKARLEAAMKVAADHELSLIGWATDKP